MVKKVKFSDQDDNWIGSNKDDTVSALGGDDIINGSGGNDNLDGGSGNDLIKGGKGSDVLVGGTGSDIMIGGSGLDFVSYASSEAGLTVNLTDLARNTGDALGDVVSAVENLIGSDQNDDLTGTAKKNVIIGGFGDDRIYGGGDGNDELWDDKEEFGVDGADTFVFSAPTQAGLYRIMDFDVQDRIELSRADFGLHPQWKLAVGSALIIAHSDPAATTNSPTFLVEQSTGNFYFDADGNGAGEAELIANVQFHSQGYLDINDFVIV